MFEQILQAVKEHLGNDPQLAGTIPADQQDEVHEAIATHLHETLQNQSAAPGNVSAPESGLAGGILSSIESSLSSGGLGTSAITGGLVGALSGKFGLSPAITGAIAAAVPSLLQKFMHKDQPTA